jgi:alpha-methylacyl-CoA racemase
MVDGAAVLMTIMHSMRHMGMWKDERGTNLIDTGAHFYDVFATRDGKYVSVGAIEPQFYAELLEKLGLSNEKWPRQMERSEWPALKKRLAAVFATKTRAEWCEILEGSDACFAPVLSMTEAPSHPHNALRKTFVEHAGALQPAPAPRFSRTPPKLELPPSHAGEHTDAALADWGFSAEEIRKLREAGAAR